MKEKKREAQEEMAGQHQRGHEREEEGGPRRDGWTTSERS